MPAQEPVDTRPDSLRQVAPTLNQAPQATVPAEVSIETRPGATESTDQPDDAAAGESSRGFAVGHGGSGASPVSISNTTGQQSSETDGDDLRACKDPIDVVSGMMFLTQTDMDLPGLLPLLLTRTFRSNYRQGKLFGRRWSSTLDQRVKVDRKGIHYAAEDGVILHYPVPEPGRTVLPKGGSRWPLAWDRASDTITIADPVRGWARVFGPATGQSRPLSTIADRNGHLLMFIHDDNGVPMVVAHSGGYRVAIDTVGTLAGVRVSGLRLLDRRADLQGIRIVEFKYNRLGNLVETVNSSGFPLAFEYDDEDRITKWIDRLGTEYAYTYNSAGRVVRTVGSDGMLSGTMAYDTEQRITWSADSLGHVTEYHWDEYDRVVKEIDPFGRETASTWDRYGRLLSRTDPLGHTVEIEYDAAGNMTALTRPDGSVVRTEYDTRYLPVGMTGPDGKKWHYTRDEHGNLLTETDPVGAVTAYDYGMSGRLEAVTDALGNTTRVETNGAGLPISFTDALGAVTTLTRDSFGRVVRVVDPLGAVTEFGWTVEGRQLWVQSPDGAREEWVYNASGEVIEHRDPLGRATSFEVTHFGLPSARTDPDGARYEFTYSTELRLLSVINPQALTWRYEYDSVGRLLTETDFNGRTVAYSYDAAGQMASFADAGAEPVTFTRDELGRVVGYSAGEERTEFEHDPYGNVVRAENRHGAVEFARDGVGRVVAETQGGRVLRSEYDLLGRRVRRSTPSGVVSEWAYDAVGEPLSLAGSGGSLGFEYDASGRETARRLGPGAALTQAYDAVGRLTGQGLWVSPTSDPAAALTIPASAAVRAPEPETGIAEQVRAGYRNIQSRAYSYRFDGQLTAIHDRLGGARQFSLDPGGRVTVVTGATWTEKYAYDAAGNISRASDTILGDTDTSGVREVTGTLLRQAGRTTYDYDAQGRLVRTVRKTLSGESKAWEYEWNALDQLISVTAPDGASWRYSYDPFGRRSFKQRVVNDGEVAEQVLFVWDGPTLAEQIQTGPGESLGTITTWDYAPGSWTALAQSEQRHALGEGGQDEIDRDFFVIVADLVGTPKELVTPDGRIVWRQSTGLWGVSFEARPDMYFDAAAPDCRLRFPGQYHDPETGWHYNFHRYYDPETARYTSPDPLGLEPSPNQHNYVPNPLSWTDPYGLAHGQVDGGRYGALPPARNPSNLTAAPEKAVNHIPARSSYKVLTGISALVSPGTGLGIRMDRADHRLVTSTGYSAAARAWQATQRRLILTGRITEGMQMDIDDIRGTFGSKHDPAINEMIKSVSKGAALRRFLSDNEWTLRVCRSR